VSAHVRARATLGVIAAAVTMSLLGACAPLDGRSGSVEVAEDPALDLGQVEVPWWATTTTTSTTIAPVPSPQVAPAAPPAPAEAVPPVTAPPIAAAVVAPPPSTAPPWRTGVPAAPVTERDRVVAATMSSLRSSESRAVAAASLELVTYDWVARLPGWQLRFLEGRRGVRGLTFPGSRTIEVYVRGSDTPEQLAHVVAHELGHAVDVTYFTEAQRSTWLAARGLGRTTVWFPGESGVSDFATGAGDFAESFGWVHGSTGMWAGELGPPPTILQVGLLHLLAGTA
jgi:hypothetical protein